MSSIGQETRAASSPCAADDCASQQAVRSAVDAVLEIGSESVQWEWDPARNSVSLFTPHPNGGDVTVPDCVCTLDEWLRSVTPDDRQRLRARLDSLAATSTRSFEMQCRRALPGESQAWFDLRGLVVRDASGGVERVVGQQIKLSGSGEAKPSHLPSPFHDALTGLPNRRLFDRCLSAAIERVREESSFGFVVFFIDLDGFKGVNDRFGHLVGDRMLVAAAQRFSHCLRPEDVVARRDGDEFTILIEHVWEENEAAAVADRILQQLRSPMSLDGLDLAVTASIGIAASWPDLTDADDLVRRADAAMYRAKARGGDCFVAAGAASPLTPPLITPEAGAKFRA